MHGCNVHQWNMIHDVSRSSTVLLEDNVIREDFDQLEASRDNVVVFVRLIAEGKEKTFALDQPGLDRKVLLSLDRVDECQVFPNQHVVL